MTVTNRSARNAENVDRLVDALVSRDAHVVHLTHNDLDAVGADAIHRMAFGNVFSIYCSVGNFPSLLEKIGTVTGEDDLLSVTDFGYQTGIEAEIEEAKKRGWRIEWRDHHRWEEKEMDRIGRLVDFLHVDTNLCAAGITAGDLRPGDPIALEVAKVVCDYDLWKNQDPRAAVLARVLSREQNRTYVRDCLVKGKFTDPFIEQQYRVIQGELERDIRRSIRRTHLYVSRYHIAIARLFGSPSETAAAIRKEMNSDIEILIYPSGRFSIRSVPPISHLIAREFQGGGHAHAAGGSLNFSFWDRLLFHLLRNNRKIRHLVEVAESTG